MRPTQGLACFATALVVLILCGCSGRRIVIPIAPPIDSSLLPTSGLSQSADAANFPRPSIIALGAVGSSLEFWDTGMLVTNPFDPQIPRLEWMTGQTARKNPSVNAPLALTGQYDREPAVHHQVAAIPSAYHEIALSDALVAPLTDILNLTTRPWSVNTIPTPCTSLAQLDPRAPCIGHTSNVDYLVLASKALDFNHAHLNSGLQFSHILDKQVERENIYPASLTERDLPQNRGEVLALYRKPLSQEAPNRPQAGKDTRPRNRPQRTSSTRAKKNPQPKGEKCEY